MNVDITLPDGSVRNYESPVTGYQIAESIGPRLLKDAICIEIDNKFQVDYVPDYRQNIADSWPNTIDDTYAREDWDWNSKYDFKING